MYIKNPHGRHKGFRLFQQKKTVQSEVLDSINKRFIAGNMTFEWARAAVEKLREELIPAKPLAWLKDNHNIYEEWWRAKGSKKRRKSDKAARQRIEFALRHLGATSLRADEDTITTALEHLDNNQLRRALGVVNQLRTYLQIGGRFDVPRKKKVPIDYLTIEELGEVCTYLSITQRLFCQAAFGTGARTGEVYAFTKANLRNEDTHIWIAEQRRRDWSPDTTKNEKEGNAFIIPEFRIAVLDWIAIPDKEKQALRRSSRNLYDAFTKACTKTVKRKMTLHNLRHSYAHEMLMRGADLTDLRQWMRDRQSTIEDYYLKWVQTNKEMSMNTRRFG